MANELKYTYATQVTLEASGASAASTAMVAANDASLGSANHSNYPWADFSLQADFGAAVDGNSAIYIYRQDLNIDSTNDAPDPTTSTYEEKLVGIIKIKSGQSASAYYPCVDVPLTQNCQFWIKNGTTQNLSAGWVLKVTPKSFVPGA